MAVALATVGAAGAAGAAPSSAAASASNTASWVKPTSESGCPSQACTTQLKAVAAAVRSTSVPSDLTPSLAASPKDILFPPTMPYCGIGLSGTTDPRCAPDGTRPTAPRLALIGDSEAQTWAIALDGIARHNGYSFLGLAKEECTMAALNTLIPYDNRPYSQCPPFRQYAIDRVNAYRPKIVVIATLAEQYYSLDGKKISPSEYSAAMVRTIKLLEKPGRQVYVVSNPPYQEQSPPICMAAHESNFSRCMTTLSASLRDNGVWEDALRNAAQKAGARFINVYPWFCAHDTCPLVISHTDVYLDYGHMTSTFGVRLSAVMQRSLSISDACRGSAPCNSYVGVERDPYFTPSELATLNVPRP